MHEDDKKDWNTGIMTKGFIFDYGGTLDTNGHHWGKVLWNAYRDSMVPVSEEMFRKAYVYGERTLATNRIITPNHNFRSTLNEKIRLQMEWLNENGMNGNSDDYREMVLQRAYSEACCTTAKSVETLKTIADKYPIVLVSNFYGNINTVLREFGFEGLFVAVIESAVVGIRKPDPEIFKMGVRKLNMHPDEVTVVGDSYDKDILPAHAAGCHTVWLKGEGWTECTVKYPVADGIIYNLSEILKYV